MISYSEKILSIKTALREADAVVIGAGSGLSTSAGFTYTGERFYRYFGDFSQKYHISDIYSGGFYPFETLEEYWAWWSRHIYYNRYVEPINDVYQVLFNLVKDKDYFVITTNVDHQFQKAGFDKQRLFYTQGDYGLFQCSVPCHQKTYDNEILVKQMVEEQSDMRIPTKLIPYCPICGKPMTVNLRSDGTFVEDEGWNKAVERYHQFIARHDNLKVLYLELGVCSNTPIIIKYPFYQMTARNNNATYVCLNYEEERVPIAIKQRSITVNADIRCTLKQLSLTNLRK